MSASARPLSEPLPPARFVIGRDRDGRWIALSSDGLGGGMFRSRGDALRYARAQALGRGGDGPDAVTFATGQVEFRM